MSSLKTEAIKRMNELASAGIPFLFIIDFDMEQPVIIETDKAAAENILYNFEGDTNADESGSHNCNLQIEKYPLSYEDYLFSFNRVSEELKAGNSYLLNLTKPTPVKINLSLKEIFQCSRAKYKLLYKNYFVVFSPEIFVKINNGRIYSHPMKGTIDASIPGAEKIILNNYKETAEHNTIVDLIRNDLSIVAENVRVEKFRYIDELKTSSGGLLQVSSQIGGDLMSDYEKNIGNIIFKMLPAGSVTGAPKSKTVEIIKSVEGYKRGFYTGIAGICRGGNVNSCVLIRFIEQADGGLIYKSGGGITIHSDPGEEYRELVRKVYVPVI
jgi:para-aminobenzoate synthetase component I